MGVPILATHTRAVPLPRSGAVPSPGAWRIRSDDSSASFSGRASRFAPTVRAAFSGITGELVVDPDPNRSTVSVQIDLATLSTGNAVYDDLLRVADPFCIGSHPLARFESVEVCWQGDAVTVHGLLDLAGSTSSLRLTGRYACRTPVSLASLEARGTISTAILGRFDLPGASLLVPRTMDLAVRVVASPVSLGVATSGR